MSSWVSTEMGDPFADILTKQPRPTQPQPSHPLWVGVMSDSHGDG